MVNCKTKQKTSFKVCFSRKCQNKEKMKSIILIHLQSAYREKERSRIQIPMRALINLQSPFQTLLNYFLVFFTSMAYLLFLNTSIVFKFGIHLYFFSLFSNRIIYEITSRVDFKCVLCPFAITRSNFKHFVHQEIENLNVQCSQTFQSLCFGFSVAASP